MLMSRPEGKILVVDDEDAVRTMVSQVLINHGYKIRVATN